MRSSKGNRASSFIDSPRQGLKTPDMRQVFQLLFAVAGMCHAVTGAAVSTVSTVQPEVVINELLLRNDSLEGPEFRDEDGTKQGWIELYNPGSAAVLLDGYYLSDERESPRKWALPAATLEPGEHLLIWGSGKDRRELSGPFHTSFNVMASNDIVLSSLDENGEVEALDGVKVPVDCSWGRYPDGDDAWYFYTQPTPGYANTAENRRSFAIRESHVSLTVGERYQLDLLPPEAVVVWRSDNPLVQVDEVGGITASQDVLGEAARAVITAESVFGQDADSCEVTIVSWMANLSALRVVGTPSADEILGMDGESLVYTVGLDLYATSDAFASSQFLCKLPEHPVVPPLLATPFGYFLRCGKTIYRSDDLMEWTLTFAMNTGGLYHSFAHDWDNDSQTGYLYAGEYSVDPNQRHAIYRGVFPSQGQANWRTMHAFPARAEWERDSSQVDAARHIHAVVVDPFTGHVWAGTGDRDEHSKIFYSDDRAESFQLLGMGARTWCALSIWFTEQYIYWNMDTTSPQSVWRIPRSRYAEDESWPSMTPELASGRTRVGVRYYVTASGTQGRFPVAIGHLYTETVERPLDDDHRVRAIDDPEYDYKEEVARLDNGSLWYHLWVDDGAGNLMVIMGGAAEGALRDYRGRVFGLRELPDGTVDVQELVSIPSNRPTVYDSVSRYVQLKPMARDASGHIYFKGSQANHGVYQTRLAWNDNPHLHQ